MFGRVHFNVIPKATLTPPRITAILKYSKDLLSFAEIAADTHAVSILYPRKLA